MAAQFDVFLIFHPHIWSRVNIEARQQIQRIRSYMKLDIFKKWEDDQGRQRREPWMQYAWVSGFSMGSWLAQQPMIPGRRQRFERHAMLPGAICDASVPASIVGLCFGTDRQSLSLSPYLSPSLSHASSHMHALLSHEMASSDTCITS